VALLAREAVTLLASTISASGALVEIEEGLPTVWADPGRLREVMQNLLENALRFSAGRPEVHVTVGSRGRDEHGQDVVFVRDEGVGIDPRHQERIFRLFEKLDPGTDGTGVGLTIVKRIIEVHGGRIWVESEGEGRGSTFCFTLPPRET
jgi:signal transduction histidine kinase